MSFDRIWNTVAVFTVLVMLFLVQGCASDRFPVNYEKMQADQIKELVKDKSGNINCGYSSNPYGKYNLMSLQLDKSVIVNGTVMVDDQCKVTITNTPVQRGGSVVPPPQ